MGENILRCASCGAENSVDNRFCGMCGRSMMAMPAPPVPTAAPTSRNPAAESGNDLRIREVPVKRTAPERYPADFEQEVPDPRYAAPEPVEPAPAYTGGLFRMGSEPERPSRNLDYLLEDDEPRSHKGLFVFLGLIALLLAGGLGYLRFKNGALPNLMGGGKPAAHEPAAGESDAGAPSTDATSKNASSESATSAPAPSAGSGDGSGSTASNASVPAAPDSKDLTQVRPKNPAETSNVPPLAPAAATSPETKPDAGTPKIEATTPRVEAPVAKPVPPPKPAPKPEDPIVMGEKYIYGRGVPQDCARGLKTVKPAADQSNAKAMITMGALYATGHCVSRDLPTAYRFFALALRKDPENAALKQNVEMVWSQMTQLERQQAIRLTQ